MKKCFRENRMTVSVRELVEWVVREGDIDRRSRVPEAENAMLLGANAHRKLQKASGAAYQAEVPVSRTVELHFDADRPFLLTVDGRADGVIREERPDETEEKKPALTVDEIKGVFRKVSEMEGPENVHLAQAEMYAYILSEEDGCVPVSVQMTYVELKEEDAGKVPKLLPDEIRRFTFDYTYEEIRARFEHYVALYEPWIKFMVIHERERDLSVSRVTFPYPYRPGQKGIVRKVYEAVTEEKNLFVQAPTGIGKTLAMLYPVVQSVSAGMGDKIFYLTAKTVAGRAAEDAVRILSEKGLAFSCIQITAKEKLCPLEKAECDPTRCDRAKGHFSRVNDAIFDLITHETEIRTELLLSYAEKHAVCPYEFALDVSLFVDIIICDYNYVFDPHVYFRRYFSGGGTDSVLLIDEAHNLVERSREMYSAVLLKEDVLSGKKLFADGKQVVNRLVKVNRILLEMKRETEERKEWDATSLSGLYEAAASLQEAMSRYFDRHRDRGTEEEKLDLFFEVSDFVSTYDALTEGYLPYSSFTEDGRFYVKLFCIDPAARLAERLSEVRSGVFFSATFLPILYYKELLAGDPEEEAIYVDSPFDPAKKKLLISKDVSSKYTRRNRTEYGRIAGQILTMAASRTGNYLAFLPSHKFLEEVALSVEEQNDGRVEVIRQEKTMTDEERRAFLSRFKEAPERENSLLGLTVTGGLFSEAIDLKGDALIGVAVVGTGLPQVSMERELVRLYFERTGKNGFDYAYRFPGFTKVQQAVGRLIRTSSDEGVALLMDERFLYRENLKLFPREWTEYEVTDEKRLSGAIRSFWEERSEKRETIEETEERDDD